MTHTDHKAIPLERMLAHADTPARRAIHAKHFASGMPRKLGSAFERLALESARVLDLGCGYGVYLAHFARGSVGADRDAERVEFANTLGLDARELDLTQPGWGSELGSFDFIWACDILPHMEDPVQLLRAARELLRPEGCVIVNDWLWPTNRLLKRVALTLPGARAVHDEATHFHAPTRPQTEAWLEAAQLELVESWIPSFTRSWQRAMVAPFWPPRTLVAKSRR